MPPGVVTDMLPEFPDETIAVILVGESIVNPVAAIPPKLTSVAPVKFVPVIITIPAAPARVGVNDAIVGAGIKINPGNVAVPPAAVTEMFPEVPAATTAVMLVGESTVNVEAATPPKLTSVAFVRLVPVMVTMPSAPTLVGVNDEIVGAGIKINPGIVAVPPAVVTEMLPEAPAATTAVMLVGDSTVNVDAVVPPKLTFVTLINPLPVMVTVDPMNPMAGENREILGTKSDKGLAQAPRPKIPVKIWVSLTAREKASGFGRFELIAVQLPP